MRDLERVNRGDLERTVFSIRIETCIIHTCEEYLGVQLRSARCCSSAQKEDRKCNLRNLKSRSRLSKWSSAGASLESVVSSFKSANRDQMREWYSKHLGLADKGQGAMLPWREHDDPQKEHVTVWTVFPTSTKYFDPSPAPFMINYIVDDMDALLDRLKQEGVKIDAKRMDESYGRFAWIYDLDGNKIELWQPLSAKP